jgi:hypothetical protein
MTEEFSSTGIKDMHPMQIEALVQFIGLAFDLASQFEGDEAIEEVEARADELIRIFGGNGVTVRLEVELDH